MQKYYSQYKQDYFANYILNREKGVFLDIGANDGITYSNSCFFEKEKQWTGLCIEPIKETFEKLRAVRKCNCINSGVWSKKTVLRFYRAHGYAEMLSGIVDSFNDDHFKRLKNDVEKHGGTLDVLEIEVDSLNNILEHFNMYDIDFCSIDTEGSEYEILKDFDFTRFNISLIAIENQYDEDKLRNLLSEKGFTKIWRQGGDDFFIDNKLYNSLKIRIRIRLFFLKEFLARQKSRLGI